MALPRPCSTPLSPQAASTPSSLGNTCSPLPVMVRGVSGMFGSTWSCQAGGEGLRCLFTFPLLTTPPQ